MVGKGWAVKMGFRDDLLNGIKEGACSIMNSAGTAARWGAGAGFSTSGSKGTFLSVNLLATAGTAAGYFCNTPPLSPGPRQFDGGQCVGVEYTIQVTTTRFFNGQPANPNQLTAGDRRFLGPIERVYISDDKREIFVVFNGGEVAPLKSGTNASTYEDLRDIVVARKDGLPDTCGNPPANPPPLTTADRTITINVGGVNAQLALGNGILQVNGDVTAPIRINSPDYEFTGELVLNKGDINLNFGGADPRRPCVPQEPETDFPPPDDDEPPPPDDDEPIIAGVIVTTTETTEARTTTTIFQTGNPNIYAPALGYISFRLKIGDVYAWSSDIPVKLLRNYIPAPGDFPAVAVAGTPRVGVTWELTPVKGVHPTIEVD